MKYRELTEQEYMKRLRTVIAGTESLHEKVQDIGDGKATIGWGLTLNRNVNVEIWRRAGIDLSAADWAVLARVDKAKTSDEKTQLGLKLSVRIDEADADRLLRASLAEFERPADRLGMPFSDERVALTSVAYNRGPGALLGSRKASEHPVMHAIREGDRAEAWYQIRYNCWGTDKDYEPGLRKRRFAEAQVFGLYDDPDNVSRDEARNVIAMFKRHEKEIDRVEDRFGDSLDAPPAKPNRIAQANRDYPALTALYGRVPTLEDALAPAYHALGRSVSMSSAEGEAQQRTVGQTLNREPEAGNRAPAAAEHPLLSQSRDAVRRLDESLGRTYDNQSERMATSLAALAARSGIDRVDHVVLNNQTATLQKGENVFVVKGDLRDPTNHYAYMKSLDALSTPEAQSLQQLAQAEQERSRRFDALAMETQVQQRSPRMAH